MYEMALSISLPVERLAGVASYGAEWRRSIVGAARAQRGTSAAPQAAAWLAVCLYDVGVQAG